MCETQSDWRPDETESQFAVRVGPEINRQLRAAVPELVPEDLARIYPIVLRDAYRARPGSARPTIDYHARLAAAAIRCNERQGALESVVDLIRPDLIDFIERDFGSTGISWEDIEEPFLRNLGTTVLQPGNPDATRKLCKMIAKRLVLDLIRKGMHRQNIPDVDWPQFPAPEAELAESPPSGGLLEVRVKLLQAPFCCPPNLPHESLAWALSNMRRLTARKIVETCPKDRAGRPIAVKWIDLPLSRVLEEIRSGLVNSHFQNGEWTGILSQTAEALDDVLGAVLLNFNYRNRLDFAALLGRKCGETCMRDYCLLKRIAPSEHSKGESSLLLESGATKYLLATIDDWIEGVARRVQKRIFEVVW